jgi:hypothetical protein
MFRAQMGMGAGVDQLSPMPLSTPGAGAGRSPSPQEVQAMDLLQERRLFASIQRPRVRYDVEVVTKLIVYSGIAWLSVEGNPILFKHLGLAVD